MTTTDILYFAFMFALLIFSMVSAIGAAYRNGVTDGYGYSKEPNCPGYKRAGDFLKKHMSHRWHELREAKE